MKAIHAAAAPRVTSAAALAQRTKGEQACTNAVHKRFDAVAKVQATLVAA